MVFSQSNNGILIKEKRIGKEKFDSAFTMLAARFFDKKQQNNKEMQIEISE